MADLELTYSVTSSALTRPLLEGTIVPKGIRLRREEAHGMDKLSRRMLNLEFDIAEMSIATFVKGREQGLPLVALPLFTSGRRFLQGGFLMAKKARMRDLSDLKGKRMGVSQYWMSSSVWQRIVLKQVHGVSPEEVFWVTTRGERMEGLKFPSKVSITQDTSDRTPLDLLAAGEIDACMTPGNPQPGTQADQLDAVAMPAYPDRVAAQKEYFKRTGIFPIMHVTVIKEELVSEKPGLLASVCDAYQEAKNQAFAEIQASTAERRKSGIWIDEMRDLMGEDPWPYGIGPNQRPLEAFVQGAQDQGLIGRAMNLDEIFARGLPDDYR